MTPARLVSDDIFPEPTCEVCGDMGGKGEPCQKCGRVGRPRPVADESEREPF